MLETLKFIFSNFWIWLGTLILFSHLPDVLKSIFQPFKGFIVINKHYHSTEKKGGSEK